MHDISGRILTVGLTKRSFVIKMAVPASLDARLGGYPSF